MHPLFVFSFLLISNFLQISSTYTPCPPGTTLSINITSNTTYPSSFSLLIVSAHLSRDSDPSKLFMLQSSVSTSTEKESQQPNNAAIPILGGSNESGILLSLTNGVLKYDGKVLDRVVEEEGDESLEMKGLTFREIGEGEGFDERGSEEVISGMRWEVVSCGVQDYSAQFLSVSAGIGEGGLVAVGHEVGGRIFVDLKGDSSEAVYLAIVDPPEEAEKDHGEALAADNLDHKDQEAEEVGSERREVEDMVKEGTHGEGTQTGEEVDGAGTSVNSVKDEL